nr:uncharacterized protein K02A2.6-like [Onthophagus taurus]
MAHAYLQLSVDNDAADAQTIVTYKGAFRCKKLQFGLSIAPQVFQQFIDNRLRGISGVIPYFDDILIVGKSDTDLEAKVRAVLLRFKEDGLRLKKRKCVFRTECLNFLGFHISAAGVRPTKDKINAIVNTPAPANKTELQAFLGLVTFYHSFIKDKAAIAEALHKLLHKDVDFKWGAEQNDAFKKLKDILASEPLLVHYNENNSLILTCDASAYGVGCVLSQLQSSGREAPVAYHSRTLSSAERNYAQIDKEALAIVVGVKKFHNYLYGRQFCIKTDHKPLLGILRADKAIPEVLSPRFVRWVIMLSAYSYDLSYTPGKKIGHADALSRFPIKDTSGETENIADVLALECAPEQILTADEVAKETTKDVILNRILQWARNGWPKNNKDFGNEFQPFLKRKHEISCYLDCLLWGTRIIVPTGGRKRVLRTLHTAHPGIVRMKALARSYVWWPGLDDDIERLVNTSEEFQQTRNAPPKAPLHPWEWARAPWSRLHLDFAGPVKGKYFLIIVDAYSKWLEVRQVGGPSSAETIRVLRELFATHGIPDVCVSDNGTAFT